MWLVPGDTPGLTVTGAFDGLGLRGNASSPMAADGVRVPMSAMLGADGQGLDLALATALPGFLVLNAACSIGIAQALADEAGEHASHGSDASGAAAGRSAAPRSAFARILTRVHQTHFLDDTLTALESGREDAMLRVLQVKAVAAEAAAKVADTSCGCCAAPPSAGT